MREINLHGGRVALVDDSDFERANSFKWHANVRKNRDGEILTIYACATVRKESSVYRQTTLQLHRLVLGITDPSVQIDHRDHNGLNCCRSNLRVATANQNGANSRARITNTSGYKGVSWHKGDRKWAASVRFHGVRKNLGMFDTPEKAASAYNEAALALFGEFAHLNEIRRAA